jgi:hypothetical protein
MNRPDDFLSPEEETRARKADKNYENSNFSPQKIESMRSNEIKENRLVIHSFDQIVPELKNSLRNDNVCSESRI